jgi:MoaA/NifB/PqqE/SkfB family radical SAM enzyme
MNMDGGLNGNCRDIEHRLFIRRLEEFCNGDTPSGWTVDEVRMTGGEPLLNFRGILEIARCCCFMGIPAGINTNGSLLTEDIAGQLKDAGLKVVKISLDTLDEVRLRKICGKGASMRRILEGIRIAIESGFEVIIRFTLSSLNMDELLTCYEYAGAAGARRFQVKPLIEAGRGKIFGARLEPDAFSLAIKELSKASGRISIKPEILCCPPGKSFGMTSKACGSINKIYISTRGLVCSCNFLSVGEIGNIQNETLAGILKAREQKTRTLITDEYTVLGGCPQYE